MSSHLAITQKFEAPLAAASAGNQVHTDTASDFARLIQQLTTESSSSDSLHTLPSRDPLSTRAPLPTRDRQGATPQGPNPGQPFSPAAELKVSPGGNGDLVADLPGSTSAPQPETDQSPDPTAGEQVPAPEVKIAPLNHQLPITAPRHQQKSAPAKTTESARTSPTVMIAPPTPAPVPLVLRLPVFAARSANTALSDSKEGNLTETTSKQPDRAEHTETTELRPPAALELFVREKDQSAPVPVEAPPAAHAARTEQSTPAAEKSDTLQSAPGPQSSHLAAPPAAAQAQETTPAPVAAPAPLTHPQPVIVAAVPQAHYAQTTHSAPKSDTQPPSSVSHLDEMPEEPKQQPQALRSLSLEFTPDGAQDVRLHLAERAGDVHISLHSTDPALSGRLSDGVHDLVGNLSSAGYDAQAWTPEQGRQNNQRDFEDQRKGRRNPSPEQGAEEFGGLMQQPVQEVS